MSETDEGLIRGADGLLRCFWPGDDPLYVAYHDEEWGRPVADEVRVFEKMVLEGFQSGLSWRTVLHKRARFREVFAGFEPHALTRFGEEDVARLLGDAGIIRHRGKIEAAIANAKALVALHEAGESLAGLFWAHQPGPDERPARMDRASLMKLARTPSSVALSKALAKRGFRFFGPTTAYAAMQALGLVNDHFEGCAFRQGCEQARAAFTPPGLRRG